MHCASTACIVCCAMVMQPARQPGAHRARRLEAAWRGATFHHPQAAPDMNQDDIKALFDQQAAGYDAVIIFNEGQPGRTAFGAYDLDAVILEEGGHREDVADVVVDHRHPPSVKQLIASAHRSDGRPQGLGKGVPA